MKKLLAIFALTFLSLGYVQAQETQSVPADLTETIIEKLELTPAQKESVAKIMTVFQPAIEQIKNSNLNPTDKATKLNAYLDREKTNMKNVLTDTQFVKYLELTGRI